MPPKTTTTYLLIEFIVVLMLFMVLFLSGPAKGLGRAVSSAVDNLEADYFLLSDDSEELLTVSVLNADTLEQVQSMTDSDVATLDVQRMYIEYEDSTDKLGIVYFAIEPGSFLEPKTESGMGLADSTAENPIILDSDFQTEGIQLGDTIKDSSTNIEFTVAGFAEDQMYGHVSVGFITTDSYTKLRRALNPGYEPELHAIAIRGNAVENISIDGTELPDKSTVIENLPSYQAEQTTINMIVWVLAVLGALLANIPAFAMAAMLPRTMPFYLTADAACLDTVAFIVISLAASLLSVRKVAKVDPLLVIGGGEE